MRTFQQFIYDYVNILAVGAFLLAFVLPPALIWTLLMIQDFFDVSHSLVREGLVGLSALAGLVMIYAQLLSKESTERFSATRSASFLLMTIVLLLGYFCLSNIDLHCKEGALYTELGYVKKDSDLLCEAVLSSLGQSAIYITVWAYTLSSLIGFMFAIFYLVVSCLPNSVRVKVFAELPSVAPRLASESGTTTYR